MLEYIIEENPDSRLIRRAADILINNGLLVIPTDTSWSIICSIASKEGIARIKHFAPKDRDRPLTVMCSSISQVSELCHLSSSAFRVIKSLVPGPYVFILPSTNRLVKDFGLKRAEIGVRIPNNKVALGIIEALELPVLSITAKRSMIEKNLPEPEYPEEYLISGGWELEDLEGVDLILDPGEENERLVGTVLDLRSGEVIVNRLGAGPWPI